MRYQPDQKAKAKAAILEAAGRALRSNGFNGMGVDGLAAAAGVTSGAFYSNFASKEALLRDVIDAGLGEPFLSADAGAAGLKTYLRSWLADYISREHRTDPGAGCVMPSLSADVARSGVDVRLAYARKMQELIARMSDALDGTETERQRRARSIVALMVGSVAISRAMPDGDDADSIIDTALQTALMLVD